MFVLSHGCDGLDGLEDMAHVNRQGSGRNTVTAYSLLSLCSAQAAKAGQWPGAWQQGTGKGRQQQRQEPSLPIWVHAGSCCRCCCWRLTQLLMTTITTLLGMPLRSSRPLMMMAARVRGQSQIQEMSQSLQRQQQSAGVRLSPQGGQRVAAARQQLLLLLPAMTAAAREMRTTTEEAEGQGEGRGWQLEAAKFDWFKMQKMLQEGEPEQVRGGQQHLLGV